MISNKLRDALSKQVNLEMSSAYQYTGLAIFCESKAYKGAAHWFKLQSAEETLHADKIMKYLLDRGVSPVLQAIEKPEQNFRSIGEAFAAALASEQKISASLSDLAKLAVEERDLTTSAFLEWFLTEQVEEVASCQTIIDQLAMVGESGPALYLLDKEFGTRSVASEKEKAAE
jgi:ferritin